ncbi:MAG TPA: SRPBCC domain-containing protein [Streptosporangiaceae bacterium]|nr:SRPBCC domain-containing protein [Streptosporangiaceae bacterium]
MTDVTERRELTAAPEQVWLALTTADAVRGWFWPERFATVVAADAREGGQYRIASDVAGIAVGGRYTAVQPPEAISFTWQWDGEDRESTVRIELAKSQTGTELTLTHAGLADDQLGLHARGWSDCLDRLPEWLAAN